MPKNLSQLPSHSHLVKWKAQVKYTTSGVAKTVAPGFFRARISSCHTKFQSHFLLRSMLWSNFSTFTLPRCCLNKIIFLHTLAFLLHGHDTVLFFMQSNIYVSNCTLHSSDLQRFQQNSAHRAHYFLARFPTRDRAIRTRVKEFLGNPVGRRPRAEMDAGIEEWRFPLSWPSAARARLWPRPPDQDGHVGPTCQLNFGYLYNAPSHRVEPLETTTPP